VLERYLYAEDLVLGHSRSAAACIECKLHTVGDILCGRPQDYTLKCFALHCCFACLSFLQVPDTSVLERFLDAEDLVLGRCRDEAMPADAWREERERHWKKWGK
jgi:hypothetical protein